MIALAAGLFMLAGLAAVPAFAVHDLGNFELDKDATDGTTSVFIGTLGSNINATVGSITVCQATSAAPTATPFTILIDAERMSVTNIANASGGGCTGAFKRTYTVTRHFGQLASAAASHTGGENVTWLAAATLTGTDWDQVFAHTGDTTGGDPTPCSTLGAVTCAFVHDPVGATIYTTGGSKDDSDIPAWRYTNGSVPDADEINDAMAAKYVTSVGGVDHQILYFAADRFAVNGAKDFGFWFFKNPVGLTDPADGTFSGVHTIGDILILGTFTQGGATTTIRVFTWVGSGGNATPAGTVEGPDATLGDCAAAASGDRGCGTVNNTTIEVPWEYVGKGEVAHKEIASGGFVEGGLDLTRLGLEGCFSSFDAETRSSPSVTAQLKDFVLGSFESCETSLTTTPADGSGTGTALTDSDGNGVPDVQIGTGAAGVDVSDLADLTVSGTDTWSGNLHFFLCGPIDSPDTCNTGGVEIGPVAGTPVDQDTTMPVESQSANLTSVGRYCWRGFFESDTTSPGDQTDSSAGECFEVLPVTPLLSTSAGADVVLGNPITDSASLTGTAYQPGTDGDPTYPSINASMDTPADGTITFSLVGPGDCSSVPTGFTDVVVNVSGDSVDNTTYTASFTPTAIGEYTWIAVYSGNDPNTLGAGPTGCPDADEAVIVTGTSGLSTAQDWKPNDTATLTGDTDLTGTLTFTLYNSADCTGTAVTGQSYQVDVNGAASGSTFSTSNDTFTVDVNSAGDYSWLVHYDDDFLTDPADTCETTSLTIDDDVPVGP